MADGKISIIDLILNDENKEKFININKIKPYRINQLLEWIFIHSIFDIDKMTNIDKITKEIFRKEINIEPLKIVDWLTEDETNTSKLLVETLDSYLIEIVILDDEGRKTLCISSQIGCAMNCKFCATGKVGLSRNLSSDEILWEFLICKKIYKEINNIVIMGMGEPFLNFNNVKEFILALVKNKIKPYSARRITISTSGVKGFSKKIVELDIPVKLSISLHSPFDEVRKQIMPNSLSTDELLKECEYYQKNRKKRITFEYILIDGITDRTKDIEKLIEISKNFSAFINLISYNEVDGINYKASKKEKEVMKLLEKANVEYSFRYKRGQKIKGACGQLVWEKRKT